MEVDEFPGLFLIVSDFLFFFNRKFYKNIIMKNIIKTFMNIDFYFFFFSILIVLYVNYLFNEFKLLINK